VTETKTVTKRKYTTACEDFCLPCSILGMLTHRCDCSHVMTRKYMVLKLHKHEECVEKCVPVVEDCHAPACPPPAGVPGVMTPVTPGVPAYSPPTPPAPAFAPAPMHNLPGIGAYPAYPVPSTVPMSPSPPPTGRVPQNGYLSPGR